MARPANYVTQIHKKIKHCIACDVELVPDVNWTRHRQKQGEYKCKTCYKKEQLVYGNTFNKQRMFVNGEYISKKHALYKPGRYKTFEDAAFQGAYKLDSIKEGYVYAITNPAWPEWVKIGMAIDADDRCNGYQTSSPFRDYKLEHVVVASNRRAAEAEAHKSAAMIAKETKGEWFKLDIEQAKIILNNITIELKKTG